MIRIFLIFLKARSVGLAKLLSLFHISEETSDLVWEETKSIPCITFQKPSHSVSGCASSNLPLSFAVLSLLIMILQQGCHIFPYETLNKDPILQLQEKYSIHLDSTWTTKRADALLKVFESISPNLNLHFSTWKINNDDLENGIKIESKDKIKYVTISRNIFPIEASQEVVSPDKYLYHAVIQFITENGTNRPIIEFILLKRYGIHVPSQTSLIDIKTKKKSKGYSDFDNDDLMLIISVLEEFPRALHRTPQLKYIVRRIDNENRGISSARPNRGSIEFAESIFLRGHYAHNDTRKIIAHEKAHFLWAFVFNHQLKADWVKLGGWYQDSASESGWSTTKERSEFVTDYAYTENPNEDMAESIGFYFVYPDRLRSCCPEKYEFIHNRIMLMYGKRWGTSNPM